MSRFTIFCLALLCLLPLLATFAGAECSCDPQGEETTAHRSKEAFTYKIFAIASILIAGGIGVCLPILGKVFPALSPEKDIFFVIKSFAAGVILATGFIHVLPDAFEDLTSPCLPQNPWGNFPFTGFIAMVSAIGCLMIDTFLTAYHSHAAAAAADDDDNNNNNNNNNNNKSLPLYQPTTDHGETSVVVPVHTHATHGHSHASVQSDLARHRITTLVLESGIAVHSVIIGLSLGASQDPETIRPLVGALTFHQLFEGMGLGGCIFQAKFKWTSAAIMGLLFSFSTPIGIVLGIMVSKSYQDNSPTALGVQGSLNAASSGVLIYMALVDLLAADFNNPKVQTKTSLRVAVNVALLLGAALMSLIARWA